MSNLIRVSFNIILLFQIKNNPAPIIFILENLTVTVDDSTAKSAPTSYDSTIIPTGSIPTVINYNNFANP